MLGMNGTSTDGTGPSVDATTGTASGKYLFIEASSTEENTVAHLRSPPLPLNEFGQRCRLNFAYHMYGADVERLSVEVATSGNWTRVWTREGAFNSGESRFHDRWRQGTTNLARFQRQAENVTIRFVAERGENIKGDIALDDIEIQCDEEDFGDCKCDEGYSFNGEGVSSFVVFSVSDSATAMHSECDSVSPRRRQVYHPLCRPCCRR